MLIALETIPGGIPTQSPGLYRPRKSSVLERNKEDTQQNPKVHHNPIGVRCGIVPPTRKEKSGRCPIKTPGFRKRSEDNEKGRSNSAPCHRLSGTGSGTPVGPG